jgi:hypothetical protein
MSLMPRPFVTSATIKNNMIELSVELDHPDSGSYVEVSGSATQTGGAFANFYDIQEVPAGFSDTSGPYPSVNVSAHPLPANKFRDDQDVTCVIRVAKVWLTVLGRNGQTTTLKVPPPPPPPDGTKWDVVRKVSEITDDDSSDEAGPPR